MSDLRRTIINTLIDAFYEVRDNPPAVTNKPVQLQSVFPQFTTPVDVTDADLPAVSFDYGGSRRIEGAFTQEEVNIFSVYVYPITTLISGIGDGTADGIGDDLMESASAVEETIRLIVQDLNGYQIEHDDDYVSGVSVGQVEAGRDEATKYIFMEVRIDFRVNYQIPIETDF